MISLSLYIEKKLLFDILYEDRYLKSEKENESVRKTNKL